MNIRCENTLDFDNIYKLVADAFHSAPVSNGREQDYVLELRAGAGYIPELALVAEDKGRLVGHIMLTRTCVDENIFDVPVSGTESSGLFELLLLGPLSVVQERRKEGIGSLLVNEAIKRAKEMNFGAVILVGDPAYYGRFGFGRASEFGVSGPAEVPEEFILLRELTQGAMNGVAGFVSF